MQLIADSVEPVLFGNAEKILDFGRGGAACHLIRIIYLIRIKSFHLFFGDKTALIAEPLFCQVLTTIVSHFLFSAS